MITDGRLRISDWALVILLCILTAVSAGAETLESLDKQIGTVEANLARMEKEYQKLSRLNGERLQRVEQARAKQDDALIERELKSAYSVVEQMNALNANLNQLRLQKEQLCTRWAGLYRTETDALLKTADQEQDRSKKADIGRKLYQLQRRNDQLCPRGQQAAMSSGWKTLRIESFDGPREIQQKIQLLEDISRELRIRLSGLDTQYQDALKERKVRERAQEFIQEGTLFNDPSTLLTTSRTQGDSGAPVSSAEPSNYGAQEVTGESGTSASLSAQEWHSKETWENREKNYLKNRAELLSHQKELQGKIEEFQKKAEEFQVP